MAIRNTATRFVANLVTFVALEVASLVLIGNSSSAHNIFFSKWAVSVSAVTYRVAYSVGSYFRLRKVNEDLNDRNFDLYRAVARQNIGPGSFQSVDTEHSFNFQKAMIIGAKHGSAHNYFIINKGSRDGVEKNCGVITPEGVVGIVQAVCPSVSYVTSFQNFEMSVSARIGTDGITGPLVWDRKSSSKARMENIPIHYNVEKGDTVFTSGYSVFYPGDIPLGTVESTSADLGTSAVLKVRLFEDFRSLKYVIVCKSAYFNEIEELIRSHE